MKWFLLAPQYHLLTWVWMLVLTFYVIDTNRAAKKIKKQLILLLNLFGRKQ